jgi:hypothetical protein
MTELNTLTALHPVPFDFKLMPYPASTGILLLPFAVIPFSMSAYLFKLVSTGVLVFGTVRAVQNTQPASSKGLQYASIVTLLLLWSPVRWAASNLQLITLIAGLYGLFVSLKPHQNGMWRIVIFVFVLGLKFTAVVPFLIIFALLKQWKALTVSVIIGAGLLLASFLSTGFPKSLLDYVNNLKEFSKFQHPEDAVTPYVHDAGIRLDLSYFINGFFVNLPHVSLLSILITVLLITTILRYGSGDFQCLHGKITLVATTGVGLLWTYQHVYAWVIFVPIFALLLCEATWAKLSQSLRLIVCLILIYGFTTATNLTTALLRSHVGEYAVIIFRTYPSLLLFSLTLAALLHLQNYNRNKNSSTRAKK